MDVNDDTTDENDEQPLVCITGVTGPAAIRSGTTHRDPVGIGSIYGARRWHRGIMIPEDSVGS